MPPRVPSDWFARAFGEEYLAVYRGRDDAQGEIETAFAVEALRLAAPSLLLDLGCGAGRHSASLGARGFEVIGLDLSLPLLRRGRRERDARFVLADMRFLPFAAANAPGAPAPERARLSSNALVLGLARAGFDAVLSFFTSFGYFFEERENARVLAEVARVLRPRGRFLIDLMDRAFAMARLVPESERTHGDTRIEEKRWLSTDRLRIEKEILVRDRGGERRYHESVRLYDRSEMERLLEAACLRVGAVYGDFGGSRHREGATPRMILTGERVDV